jgi:hypothetical protein
VGTWRLCGDSLNLSPDVVWLLGGAATIQLDGTYFWRLPAGQTSHGAQSASGMYFRLLEGNHGLLQFVDSDVASGGGATLAIAYFPANGVLQVASCDGVESCASVVARLVPAGGGAGP